MKPMRRWRAIRRATAALCLAGDLSWSLPSRAAEYGLSEYVLGLTMPMSGYTPPPGVYFWDVFYLYHGGGYLYPGSGSRSSTRVTYNFLADGAIIGWFPDAELFGAALGFAANIPFVGFKNTASASFAEALGVNQQISRADAINALGDTEFAAILGWHAGEQHWNVTLTGFMPTGAFESDRLAKTGLNRPALDLKGAYTFLSLQTGVEVSAGLGVTVNAMDTATNYQSGAELHFEWALNQHFPFGLEAGVGGYFYQQITNDSGTGDQFGAFRGRVAAIGPLLSYTIKADGQQVTLSGRWFHEFAAEHRVRGDAIFATLSFPL